MGSIQRRRHSVEMSIAATEPSKKRQKLSEQLEADAAEVEVSGSESGFSSAIEDELPSEDEQAPDGWPDQDSDDSEEQDILLANARKQGLLKTSSAPCLSGQFSSQLLTCEFPPERKRALSPDAFGQSLVSLLSAPEPSAKALAKLNKPMHRTAADDALENKALKLVQAKKHEKREHAHVKDVIANWGPRPKKPFSQWTPEELSQDWVPPEDPEAYVPGGGEGEKVLRRLAQRGTVRLFNAIRVGDILSPLPVCTELTSRSDLGCARHHRG